MRSLAVHLHDSAGHDRLPFHPACPICRETRLTGRFPTDELVSPRAQALLAASVLAVSSTAPAAMAVAAEQDQQQDGTAAVTQATSDPADNPDFDPGGDATDLPKTAPPVAQTQAPPDPGNDDTAAVDQTTGNPDDPVVDSGDGSDAAVTTPAAPTQGTSPDASTTAAPAAAAAGTSEPTSTPGSTTAPAPSEVAAAVSPPRAAPRSSRVSRASQSSRRRARPAPRTTSHSRTVPTAPVPTPPTATPAATVSTPPAVGHHAAPGDPAHTVLAGESLWTIATDLLGGDASTARVAREVHRLWQLNRDRIGTGNPDLLMIGTRLELR